jgi:hypothetical protein
MHVRVIPQCGIQGYGRSDIAIWKGGIDVATDEKVRSIKSVKQTVHFDPLST